MSFDGSVVSRLEGSSDAPGGLVVKKYNKSATKSSTGGGSQLGLQKLAEQKRKEREEEEERNRKNLRSETWEDVDERNSMSTLAKHRHYRSKMVETPSHPGGVSDEYREKKRRRDERDREQRRGGVYANTKGKRNQEDHRDKVRSNRDSREDKGSRRSSRSRGDSTRSTRDGYNWEDTPSSRRSREEREYTPSYGNRGMINIMKCLQIY